MSDTIIVTLKGPGNTFEDMYKQMYEDSKVGAYEQIENLDDNYQQMIKLMVERNMVGPVSKKYGGDQECFRALGIVYTFAKELLPKSGIAEIAENTFDKMYDNMKKYENMKFDHHDPNMTDEDRRRHAIDLKYIDTEFDVIVNEGAEEILERLKA